MSAAMVCSSCGEAKRADEMSRNHGRPAQPCKACKAAAAREWQRAAAEQRQTLRIDPCPVCGVCQAEHFKCARCTSRGHAMGRGAIRADLCAWCEAELVGRR